jgi:hypothetical protein
MARSFEGTIIDRVTSSTRISRAGLARGRAVRLRGPRRPPNRFGSLGGSNRAAWRAPNWQNVPQHRYGDDLHRVQTQLSIVPGYACHAHFNKIRGISPVQAYGNISKTYFRVDFNKRSAGW